MPPTKKHFKTGEVVFGLWPGSGGLYFKGVIVECDLADGTYDVKFEEGTTYTLLDKHVKPVDSFKALEPKSSQRQVRRRARSSSVSRSRSRSRTPGRKPRGRSPSKEKKTEVKSSPKQEKEIKAETKGSPTEKESKPVVKRSPEQKSKTKSTEGKEVKVSDVQKSPRRSTRVKPEPKEVKEESHEEELMSRRRSTRLIEKSKIAKEQEKAEEKTGSDESKPNGKDQVETKPGQGLENEGLFEPLNCFTALLSIFSYLSLIFFFYLTCKQNKCLFNGIPQFSLSDIRSLYNPFVSFCIEGFYLSIFLLSLLPTGEIITIGDGQTVRRNSFLIATILLSSLLASKHFFQFSAFKIMKHLYQFLIPNVVVTFVLAVAVCLRTRGERRNDQSFLSHFINGSSINPTIAGVNVKLLVHRGTFASMIALNVLALEAHYEEYQAFSPSLTFVSGMQIVYALEALWNDAHVLHSLEFTQLKTGWVALTMMAYPFMPFLITLSVIHLGTELPYYCLAPIGVLFLAGLWIKAGSNSQKAAFIKDPSNPLFANMEVLTTAADEKLLISGWWGWLRHPNYLGDFMMHLAFVLPCGLKMFLPLSVVLFITICLIHKAVQHDVASKLKYGPSWDRYCQRVPSRVIPRIF